MDWKATRQSSTKAAPRGDPAATRESLRPGLYALIVICALVAAFVFKERTQGIFACPDAATGGDYYLAYCNALAFGDYDRGAFWLALEPEAREAASAADVLFLGSSRMQFAFSTNATTAWFSRAGASFYLLGFSHTEDVVFTEPLLASLKPHARVYVINVDRFFDDRETPPTREILHNKNVRSRYRKKQFWQLPHRLLCGTLPFLCGRNISFVRFRRDGTWKLRGTGPFKATGVADGQAMDRQKWPKYEQIAREFVARLPVDRNCIVLTLVPSKETKNGEARAIADSLGLPLIAPRPAGLRTFDSSHLNPPSAQLWSSAFFEAAGEQIKECLGTRTSRRTDEAPISTDS